MSSATSAGLRFLQQPPAGPRFLQQTPSRPQLKNPIVGRQAVQANDPLYFIREKQWVVQTTPRPPASPRKAVGRQERLWVKPQKAPESCGSSSKAVDHSASCGSSKPQLWVVRQASEAPERLWVVWVVQVKLWVCKPQKAPEGCGSSSKAVGRPASPRKAVGPSPKGPRRLWVVQQSCGSSCKPQKAPEGCGSSSKAVGRPASPRRPQKAVGRLARLWVVQLSPRRPQKPVGSPESPRMLQKLVGHPLNLMVVQKTPIGPKSL